MDLLKQYLVEALELAKGRDIGIFGFGAFGAVAYNALVSMGISPYCFYDVDAIRLGTPYFGKEVRELSKCVEDSVFVIDVYNNPDSMKKRARELNLIENEDYSSLHGIFGYKKCDMVDPLLVYNRVDDYIGFTVFDQRKKGSDALRIVTLGGSTSDCTFGGVTSWSEYLHQILADRNIDNVVMSGGLVGYTSAQERDKFLRDVLPMKPDVVVSLTGDNDVGWSHGDPENNYYSTYLAQQIVEPIYSHCLRPNESIRFGLNEKMSSAERWFRNHSIIHSTASEFDITALCFLQPCILSESYEMSDFEKGWMECLKRNGLGEVSTIDRLFEYYSDFYREASELMAFAEGFVDITDSFSSYSGVYIDGIHCSDEGNRIIADRIADEILNLKKVSHE